MGIGNNLKPLIGDGTSSESPSMRKDVPTRPMPASTDDIDNKVQHSAPDQLNQQNKMTGPRKLPPGSGPGTSGKPAPADSHDSSADRGARSTGFAKPVGDRRFDDEKPAGRIINQGSSTARHANPTDMASSHIGAPGAQERDTQAATTNVGHQTIGTDATVQRRIRTEQGGDQGTGGPRQSPPTGFGADAATAITGDNRRDGQNRGMASLENDHPPGLASPGAQSSVTAEDSAQSRGSPKAAGDDQTGEPVSRASGIQAIPHPHTTGHSQPSTEFAESNEQTIDKTHQLKPVTHEHVRHIEVEEVTRQKEHDRHIHHIQHHTQPVIVSEVRPEQHHDRIHPVTNVQEQHANSADERNLLDSQVRQNRDTVEHGAKETVVIDKGTNVHENVQHHVHHVVQPIIEKESIDRSRIHTVIPIHQVSHEIPVVREPRILAPVSLDGFVETQAGPMSRDSEQARAANTTHHCSSCTCGGDQLGDSLERDLRIGDHSTKRDGGGRELPKDNYDQQNSVAN